MAEGRLVDVEVEQARPTRRVGHGQAQLLFGLAPGGDRGRLPGVDVPSGLHPAAETLVEVEHRAPPAHDHGRGGDVRGVGVLVGGIGQAVELGQEALAWPRPPGARWVDATSPVPGGRWMRSRHAAIASTGGPRERSWHVPAMCTRSPAGRTESTAPRLESCRATKSGRPRTLDQYGPAVHWADPVAGSSSIPTFGPKTRRT